MDVFQNIRVLCEKNRMAIPFTDEDIVTAEKIADCSDDSCKIDLIFLLGEHIEDWSYEILKKLSKDSNEIVCIHAIKKISYFLRTQDFWTLYENFADGSQFVIAAAIAALDYIGVTKEIDAEIRIQRLLKIKEQIPDSFVYVHLVINTKLFLDTEEEMYLENICRHVHDPDEDVKWQAQDSLDEIIANLENEEAVVQNIKRLRC